MKVDFSITREGGVGDLRKQKRTRQNNRADLTQTKTYFYY